MSNTLQRKDISYHTTINFKGAGDYKCQTVVDYLMANVA